jgi:hypothetical protein
VICAQNSLCLGKKKVKWSLYLWRCMVEWRSSSTIFDLSTSWRWVVSQHPLDSDWVGPESVWMLWSRQKPLAPNGNRTPAIQPTAHCYPTLPVTWSVAQKGLKCFIYIYIYIYIYIVACCLKAGIVESDRKLISRIRRPSLGNDSVNHAWKQECWSPLPQQHRMGARCQYNE